MQHLILGSALRLYVLETAMINSSEIVFQQQGRPRDQPTLIHPHPTKAQSSPQISPSPSPISTPADLSFPAPLLDFRPPGSAGSTPPLPPIGDPSPRINPPRIRLRSGLSLVWWKCCPTGRCTLCRFTRGWAGRGVGRGM